MGIGDISSFPLSSTDDPLLRNIFSGVVCSTSQEIPSVICSKVRLYDGPDLKVFILVGWD